MSEKQQHEKITGYRTLSDAEIEAMNKIKAKGEELAVLVDEISEIEGIELRWVAIGKTDLQTGLMALTRAVAKPTSF